MNYYTKEDVIRLVEEEDVEFIRLQFPDMFGHLKNMAVTASQLEKALSNRISFDGSAIDGFVKVDEEDMYLYPDPTTFEIFPWRPQQGKVARMFCNVYRPNGTVFEGDSRYVLANVVEKAKQAGYVLEVAPECEFFLFDIDENANATTDTKEQAGFFDVGPLDFGENARRDIVMNLEDMGFTVESSHHEKSPAQHEIRFMKDEALYTADNLMTFRLTVRTLAKRHGLHATFMPKPLNEKHGSGMHLNLMLHKNGKNIFGDAADEKGLSEEAYFFIGGLLKHIKAITAITNPTVNSYKRLIPTGANASLLRIPNIASDEGAKVELRSPDSTCNPYLALAVILAAGLDGIENRIMPKSIDVNLDTLPKSLAEAVIALKRDSFICDVLGKDITESYIRAKMDEHTRFISAVTDWETREYLNRY